MKPDIFLKRAEEMKDYLVDIRRYIHQNAEVGFDTVKTSEFVMSELEKAGVSGRRTDGTGIIADIGHGEDIILLRADMDALPMYELNDLSFRPERKAAHCCGHDLHTSMLIGAAKILKEHEDKLKRTVRLMFQPDEEGGTGALRMINKGILENEEISGAIALHVDAKSPLGVLEYGYGKTFSSNDNFEIIITGKGGHGARAYETTDPINIAFNIYNGLSSIINRETDPFEHTLFSVTSMEAESTFNIIPDSVNMKGTLRTYNEEIRKHLLERFKKMTELTAEAFKAHAKFIVKNSLPALETSTDFTDEVLKIASCLGDSIKIKNTPVIKRGSEDFAYVTQKIKKNAYLFIGAGKNINEGNEYGQHNSRVIFNEDVLPLGTALLSFVAFSK